MSENPSSALLGAEESRRPPSQSSKGSKASRRSKNSQNVDEASPLLGDNHDRREYGDGLRHEDSVAESSLRSLRDGGTSKKKSRRWPSIIAFTILCVIMIVILGLGFAAPEIAEEYAKEAMVFEPTSLSIDSFTSTGVNARIKGNFRLDGSRVHKKSVRDLGRAGTWVAKAVESKQSRVTVYLPEYDDILLGTAIIPPIVVSIRDGVTTSVDFIAEIAAGDLDGLRRMANAWLEGRIGSLSVRGVADVSLKSGIIGLGTQSISETVVFAGNKLPTVPEYTITKLNFREADEDDNTKGMVAEVSVLVKNDYPVRFGIPSLGFSILVQDCSPDLPYISVADAVTNKIFVEPRQDIQVHVNGLVRTLPDQLTAACPEIQKSPLDVLVGGYVRGDETTVYLRGSEHPVPGTPTWISDFMKSIVVPVGFPGKTFENLIRNFSMDDVHFSLPNPFAGPDSPESKPTVSAVVKALVGLPDEMNFSADIAKVKADADIYYHDKKLGQLDLSRWQKAKSKRIEAHNNTGPCLAVTSVVKDAPINITNDDVFAKMVKAMVFGDKEVVLGVKAAVDVETETVLGKLVIRDIPGEGKVFVKPLSSDGKDLKALAPEVGSLRILNTTESTIKLEAKVNVTNPTKYSATVPYVNIELLCNGSQLGYAFATDVNVGPGPNHNILVQALWDPPNERGKAQGQELLSQYVSGFNTSITLRTHSGTIPSQPALGLALSNFSLDLPTPSLPTPKNPSKPGDDRDPEAPTFIDDATFHILTSTASFTLLSPLPTTSIFITFLNATALYNHTMSVGNIFYDLPWEVPPGVSTSPRLPVDWDVTGVAYQALKDAVGGRLKLDAKADARIKVGEWEQSLWMVGRGIGAGIRI